MGYLAAILGYVVIAGAMLASGLSKEEQARSKVFVGQVLGYRPGLPLVVVGLILTVLAFVSTTWFSPQHYNTTFFDLHDRFLGTGLAPLAVQYALWLGWGLHFAWIASLGILFGFPVNGLDNISTVVQTRAIGPEASSP